MDPLDSACRFTEPICPMMCVYRFACLLESYQDEQAVRGEFLVSRDGGIHREDQTAKHQDKTVETHTQI